jgi:hypothetical protein
MIKQVGWFVFGLILIIFLAILNTLKIIKVDDEYGF